MHHKQIDVKADLELLNQQKEAAVVNAEYEAVIEETKSQHDVESLRMLP